MPNTVTSTRAQLVLLHLTDSALPTGGFSHSFGLEDYLLREIVHDEETYEGWLHEYIRQVAYTEGLVARFAAELTLRAVAGEDVMEELGALDTAAHVSLIPEQIRTANASMGKRMSRVVRHVAPDVEISAHYSTGIEEGLYYGCPAIAYGVTLAGLDVDAATVVRSYLMQLTSSINQNAIRGIPIGQEAGQRVLAGTYPVIEEAVELVLELGMVDLGASPPGLELAQMHHETQHSRMFMS